MNDSTDTENKSVELEKPVLVPQDEDVKFPPFPEPTDADFDEDITIEERNHYRTKFKDLKTVVAQRIHCSACDRHLGCSPRNVSRLRPHPLLRTLMCHTCFIFYNSGEFEKGDDGSELYCRWCGQGGQVYCCSACPHVFCAKCIKRNFGLPMIREIEDTDDWKCFKCNPKYLWDLRAVCWAVLRYCELKNKITSLTEDAKLKELYQKSCALDLSICCKSKNRKKKIEEKNEDKKPKQKEDPKKITDTPVKLPSTIQVKKFASINIEEQNAKTDKRPQKRPASPKTKPIIIKNSMPMGPKMLTPVIMPPMAKKIRMAHTSMINPVRFSNDRKIGNTYTRIRPRPPIHQMMYNGLNNNSSFNQMIISDNINLSLESLTQGLDMSAVAGMANSTPDDGVVCTPDFALEPLCEVTEDNNDDDVQCIGPVIATKAPMPPAPPPPPLVPRNTALPILATDNIIQMTDNDVTVNAMTGGLKFRVDPQTLSSNKMYRLPDGRIFAINANPSMPGGYSATIVAVTEDASSKMPPKGAIYAAKLSSLGTQQVTPPSLKTYRNQDNSSKSKPKRSSTKSNKGNKNTQNPARECDMTVPVEWFRYNLIDAVDAVEYSLSRLKKLKQEATTMYLRTRSVNEMRTIHKRLECLLNNSTSRFEEVRDNLSKEFKQYLMKKMGANHVSEDDDDVEILQDDNDDPIFIDENSVESTVNESQEVDLTGLGSDHNDSSDKTVDKNDGIQILEPLCVIGHEDSYNDDSSVLPDKTALDDESLLIDNSIQREDSILSDNTNNVKENEDKDSEKHNSETNNSGSVASEDGDDVTLEDTEQTADNAVSATRKECAIRIDNINGVECDETKSILVEDSSIENKADDDKNKDDRTSQSCKANKTDDIEIKKEIIEDLLKDDNIDVDKQNLTPMDISA